MSTLAVIGGTGLEDLEGLVPVRAHSVDTPYGSPSRAVVEGQLGGTRVLFLHRHGSPDAIPPHLVNYRANLWALRELGAQQVLAINAVGGISDGMRPGRLVIPDQVIDYTWGREHTVDTGANGELLHIDFTEPYDRELRTAVLQAAQRESIEHAACAVHGVTQGPRLESAAEIRRLAQDGCDIVGMTGMPEASLARELGLAYASICMVVNAAAGLDDQPLTLETMRANLASEAAVVRRLIGAIAAAFSG